MGADLDECSFTTKQNRVDRPLEGVDMIVPLIYDVTS